MLDDVLKRYALAYIKKSGSANDVLGFLRFCNTRNITDWCNEDFGKVYKGFIDEHNVGSSHRDDGSSRQQPTGRQGTHIHVHNDNSLSFWDCLLLQCWIDSLFSRRSHTTVNNITNINNYSNSGHQNNGDKQSREDKKKDSEDNRKLLALGIAFVAVCVALHVLMCFYYSSSKKEARKSEEIDYLDKRLKRLRNAEFSVSAISLAILIYCTVNPVLPVWGLVICGINSLVCFAGGLAFHMKHEKESENIEKARKAVEGYHERRSEHSSGDSSHHEPPPAYSSHGFNTAPSAPPQSEFGNPYSEQYFGQQTTCSKDANYGLERE